MYQYSHSRDNKTSDQLMQVLSISWCNVAPVNQLIHQVGSLPAGWQMIRRRRRRLWAGGAREEKLGGVTTLEDGDAATSTSSHQQDHRSHPFLIHSLNGKIWSNLIRFDFMPGAGGSPLWSLSHIDPILKHTFRGKIVYLKLLQLHKLLMRNRRPLNGGLKVDSVVTICTFANNPNGPWKMFLIQKQNAEP